MPTIWELISRNHTAEICDRFYSPESCEPWLQACGVWASARIWAMIGRYSGAIFTPGSVNMIDFDRPAPSLVAWLHTR